MHLRTLATIVAAGFVAAACGRIDTPRTEQAALDRDRERPETQRQQTTTTEPPTPPRVAMPAPEALTDTAITGRILSALKADPAMDGADVSINTDRGVVVLSGTVKSHEQTGIASAHAQRQDGVMRVDNNLRPEVT